MFVIKLNILEFAPTHQIIFLRILKRGLDASKLKKKIFEEAFIKFSTKQNKNQQILAFEKKMKIFILFLFLFSSMTLWINPCDCNQAYIRKFHVNLFFFFL